MAAEPGSALSRDTAAQGERRPDVLVLLGSFWPGSEASGPVKSLRMMAQTLSDRFTFRLVARDRPFGAEKPLAPAGQWQQREHYQILYCAQAPRIGVMGLGEVLRTTPHDVLILNGFYDHEFTLPTLMMRCIGRVPRRPTILSTRGEFADGAQGLKSARKRVYTSMARGLGLLGDVRLHATSAIERDDILRRCTCSAGVDVAPVISPLAPLSRAWVPRRAGEPMRIAFLGRISRVKNLDYALKVLQLVRAPVVFDIFGPIQDASYWAECAALISVLPALVTVAHKGEIANEDVARTFEGYDLFFLPTAGENFGHAIAEALGAGVPALISDRTPWRDLAAQQAGWDLPLDVPSAFAERIDEMAQATTEQHSALRQGARRHAEREARVDEAIAATERMIRGALASAVGAGR